MRKAAWVYSGDERYLRMVSDCRNGLKDFFTRFARVVFTEGTVDVGMKGVTNAWKDAGYIHPMISVARPEGKKMRKVGNPELTRIIDELMERGICEYSGIHTNIEPYHKGQLRFFNLLKEKTGKRISASIPSNWDKNIIRCVDMAVLMAYDYHNDPEQYINMFKRRVDRFGETCEELRTDWMVGIPVVATHTEFEAVLTKESKLHAEGNPMERYFLPAYNFLKGVSSDSTHFKGAAIWAFCRGSLKTKEGHEIHPWHMDLDELRQLE
jgi:hypothetical protein